MSIIYLSMSFGHHADDLVCVVERTSCILLPSLTKCLPCVVLLMIPLEYFLLTWLGSSPEKNWSIEKTNTDISKHLPFNLTCMNASRASKTVNSVHSFSIIADTAIKSYWQGNSKKAGQSSVLRRCIDAVLKTRSRGLSVQRSENRFGFWRRYLVAVQWPAKQKKCSQPHSFLCPILRTGQINF